MLQGNDVYHAELELVATSEEVATLNLGFVMASIFGAVNCQVSVRTFPGNDASKVGVNATLSEIYISASEAECCLQVNMSRSSSRLPSLTITPSSTNSHHTKLQLLDTSRIQSILKHTLKPLDLQRLSGARLLFAQGFDQKRLLTGYQTGSYSARLHFITNLQW